MARRNAGIGALIASLPLVSILGMFWLWRDTHDPIRLANHAQETLWYVAPSPPMFLIIPALLRAGWGFGAALGLGCTVTVFLYLAVFWLAPRLGITI